MVYVYFGPDIGKTVAKAREDFRESDKKEPRLSIPYDGYNSLVQDAVSEAESLPLFGEPKRVVVSNAYYLSPDGRKSKGTVAESDQDYAALLNYLKHPEESADLVFLVEGSLDSKSDLVQALKALPALFVSVGEMTEEDFVALALKKAKEEDKTVDRDAARLLYERTGSKSYGKTSGNYLLFVNELCKLLTYTDHVTEQDVALLVARPLDNNVFDLVSDLSQRKSREALLLYRDLRKGGNDPLRILAAMAGQFRFLALVKYRTQYGRGDCEAIGKELGASRGRVYYASKEAKAYSYDRLIDVLADLGEIENGIKANLDPADARLEAFFASFPSRYLS